ncbi:MAG: thioredoxin domain-containing protein [Thermodesulfobacteriota bacterium]
MHTASEHPSPDSGRIPAEAPANALIQEKSPYLLQHAHNPVHWYPWGEEAFAKAHGEDKPVFLSIGYSTCHWCHVMAHESFEDSEIAAALNDTFVSIKVDREERPDIDHLYMTVCQIMTKSGGWPLTILMTPDGKPFFAATYLPKRSMFGRLGLLDLTMQVKKLWSDRRAEVIESAESIAAALRQTAWETPGEALDETVLNTAYRKFRQVYDPDHGGFGNAPKFPTPHNLMWLLRYWKRTGEPMALHMVEQTLQSMRRGGIYDHVGFGFHRYSTDRTWLLPHFEKMLYDQGLISLAYLEAFQATGKPEYAKTAAEVFAYVLRDLTSPAGAFYGAEDADSEGVEGKFYVWSFEEIREVVGPEDADLMVQAFHVLPKGNHLEEATGHRTGTNILHHHEPLAMAAVEMGVTIENLTDRLARARRLLFESREKRVHPHKDDKVLTDWNGLMIAALARGAQVLGDREYASAAQRAADFVLKTLRDERGRLLHRYRDGEAGIAGSVDDYAFLVWGLIELYEATFETRYLRAAVELTREMLARFWDDKAGGLFFTPLDGEELLARKKEIYDGATPSGNSVAALNLLRLARITADPDLEHRAARISGAFAGSIREFPTGYTQMLIALEFALGPSREVVVVGNPEADPTGRMLSALREAFLPNKVVVFKRTDTPDPELIELIPFAANLTPLDGNATAYVCENFTCDLPTTHPEEMLRKMA